MGVCAYTIVSRAYVPHARVLARTFSEQHHDGQFWALLIDDIDQEITEVDEPFRVLRLPDLDVAQAELHRMAMLFGNRLIAAIKPWVFEHLLRSGADSVIYIDSDFMIFDSLEEVAERAIEHGVVVVPHVLTPVPRDGHQPDETTILGVGTFNAGFFAVGRDGGPLLEFLKVRLRRECYTSVPNMRVNEQRWLDFVPALFSHYVLRDPGVDAAPWNTHERPLTIVDDRYMIGDRPLRAFHFSGFDPRLPHVMSARDYWERPRVPMENEPALEQLYSSYVSELFDAGYEQHHRIPFAYDSLADGTLIYASLRGLFSDALARAEAAGGPLPPDPFDAAGTSRFKTWAQHAYEEAGERLPPRLAGMAEVSVMAEDWTSRMAVGEAGERTSAGVVRLYPGKTGTVLVGPGTSMDTGQYRAIVELWLEEAPSDASSDADVVLIEALLDGYVLGCAAVHQRAGTAAEVEFVVPSRLRSMALSAGVQVCIQSRSGVGGTIDSVLVERLGDLDPALEEAWSPVWLAAMSVGDVGERTASTIAKRSGRRGFMAEGPRWRLAEGRYRADLGLRSTSVQHDDGSTVVALVDVVVHGYVIGFRSVTWDELATGRTSFEFAIGGRWAHDRYTRVELRIRAETEVDAVLESASVHPIGEVGMVEETWGEDWLPALWVHGAALRSGTEVHSAGRSASIIAQGPSWRLDPGRYQLAVAIDAPGHTTDGDGSAVAAVVQVLLDGSKVAERQISVDEVTQSDSRPPAVALEFEVAARRVPAPLLEMTPITDLVLSSEGVCPLRIQSAVVSRIGGAE